MEYLVKLLLVLVFSTTLSVVVVGGLACTSVFMDWPKGLTILLIVMTAVGSYTLGIMSSPWRKN